MDWKIQLSELNYDGEEKKAVNRVLKSQWLTMGNECQKFEQEFSTAIQSQHQGVFVSSATAALHLILMALNIKKDDEVIIPALTFVSDANLVMQMGAKPVFADSESITNLNVSIDDIEKKITPRTKAIVIVHFAGFPVHLERLKLICANRGIALIEDCAHAPGAKIGNNFCGTIGDFSFFSFFSNKNLSIGEGGMAFANNEAMIEKIRLMRSHGMTSVTLDRHLGRTTSYDVRYIGLNYRPDEIRGALGRVQLKKLTIGNQNRKNIFHQYCSGFTETTITVPFCTYSANICPAFHIMPIILPKSTKRHNVISRLKEQNIQTSIHYPSFKEFTAYKGVTSGMETPIADIICAQELTLPLHPKMTTKQVNSVVKSVLDAVS